MGGSRSAERCSPERPFHRTAASGTAPATPGSTRARVLRGRKRTRAGAQWSHDPAGASWHRVPRHPGADGGRAGQRARRSRSRTPAGLARCRAPCSTWTASATELAAIRAQTTGRSTSTSSATPSRSPTPSATGPGGRAVAVLRGVRHRRQRHSGGTRTSAVQRRDRRRARGVQAGGGELPLRPAVARTWWLACARWGAKILSSATTVDEARWLEAHGVDAVIAQGLEAGGHRGIFLSEDLSTQIGTLALVPQIVRGREGPGDCRRRHRRREGRRGRHGAGRGRRADRHRLPAVPGGDDQRAASRGARRAIARASPPSPTSSPAVPLAASSIASCASSGPMSAAAPGVPAGGAGRLRAAREGRERWAATTSRRCGRGRTPAAAGRSPRPT